MTPNKYLRPLPGALRDCRIDVYDVLTAFGVRCPATAHAIKKLLMPCLRGANTAEQDLREAIQAIERAIQLLPENPAPCSA